MYFHCRFSGGTEFGALGRRQRGAARSQLESTRYDPLQRRWWTRRHRTGRRPTTLHAGSQSSMCQMNLFINRKFAYSCLIFVQDLDIPRVVSQLRQQRDNIIPSLAQYKFMYALLIHYLKQTRLIWNHNMSFVDNNRFVCQLPTIHKRYLEPVVLTHFPISNSHIPTHSLLYNSTSNESLHCISLTGHLTSLTKQHVLHTLNSTHENILKCSTDNHITVYPTHADGVLLLG